MRNQQWYQHRDRYHIVETMSEPRGDIVDIETYCGIEQTLDVSQVKTGEPLEYVRRDGGVCHTCASLEDDAQRERGNVTQEGGVPAAEAVMAELEREHKPAKAQKAEEDT